MTLKKSFKKSFSGGEKTISIFYASSKIVFIMTAFIFFLVYFFISAGFYDVLLLNIFLPLYLSFLVSFIIFLCMLCFKLGYKKVPFLVLIVACILLISLGGFFLTPVF